MYIHEHWQCLYCIFEIYDKRETKARIENLEAPEDSQWSICSIWHVSVCMDGVLGSINATVLFIAIKTHNAMS